MAKAPGDAVVGVGTGDRVSAVRACTRVVDRPFGVDAYVACASVPDGSPILGETVNEEPISAITGVTLYSATDTLLQVFVIESAKTLQPLCPNAMATGARDMVSKEPTC